MKAFLLVPLAAKTATPTAAKKPAAAAKMSVDSYGSISSILSREAGPARQDFDQGNLIFTYTQEITGISQWPIN